MGTVWRVRDRCSREILAMKVMRRRHANLRCARQLFLAEARVTSRLRGVPAVRSIGCLTDGRLYFTMEEVRGWTFQILIDAANGDTLHLAEPWSLDDQLAALRGACRVIDSAHRQGVVHRDLKPANLMMTGRGTVRVLDWGLAREIGVPAPCRGFVTGTPAYMAPQQAWADPNLDHRTDVYALGAILYHILTGRPPLSGADDAILSRLRDGERPAPIDPRAARRDVIAICEQAMAPDPERRFQTARAMAEALGGALRSRYSRLRRHG